MHTCLMSSYIVVLGTYFALMLIQRVSAEYIIIIAVLYQWSF